MKILKLYQRVSFFSVLALLLLAPQASTAAIPVGGITPPAHILISKAGDIQSVQGGQSGRYTSLLDLRSSSSKAGKLERIVVDIGDEMKHKLVGRVGYYTVEMNNKEVVISFRQTLNSAIGASALAERLKASPYVANSRMHFEPIAQTTHLVLELKRTAKLHVYSVSGSKKTGKLILDFSPAVL